VSDAFKFNFHEDEKAQYQPDYMEGAHSGGQATSKGEPKKKSQKKDDKGKKKRDRGGSSKRKRGQDEEAGPSSVVPEVCACCVVELRLYFAKQFETPALPESEPAHDSGCHVRHTAISAVKWIDDLPLSNLRRTPQNLDR